MAELGISRLRKVFGSTVAVEDFTLDIADGEFIALLGPSGCGKTTLMRMIAGIAEPDSGSLVLGGARIDGLPPERRNIGLVFQSYALFPHMTVAKNVAFGLRMRRLPSGDVARRVGEALGLVDLAPLADRYPRQLSGGQQQRVALARAIAIEPRLLLLDEPLSNLDAKLREQLRDDLKTLQRRLGTTTVYVTHDQSEAMALADRVVLMNGGRIVEIGAPRELYRSPRSRFTAEFLGSTNVVPGRAEPAGIVSPWGTILAPPDGSSGSVLLSVRPEDIAISASTDGRGVVSDVTFLGADVEHHIAIGELSLRARCSGRDAPIYAVGTRVAVDLPAELHRLASS